MVLLNSGAINSMLNSFFSNISGIQIPAIVALVAVIGMASGYKLRKVLQRRALIESTCGAGNDKDDVRAEARSYPVEKKLECQKCQTLVRAKLCTQRYVEMYHCSCGHSWLEPQQQ
jgi:hypothetical protein